MYELKKRYFAKIFIVISFIAIITVFGVTASGSRPIVPALVFLFKWPFGLIFLILQAIYCYQYNVKYGYLIISVVFIIMVPSIYIGGLFRWSPLALSGFDRILSGSATASALVLGFSVLRKKP